MLMCCIRTNTAVYTNAAQHLSEVSRYPRLRRDDWYHAQLDACNHTWKERMRLAPYFDHVEEDELRSARIQVLALPPLQLLSDLMISLVLSW